MRGSYDTFSNFNHAVIRIVSFSYHSNGAVHRISGPLDVTGVFSGNTWRFGLVTTKRIGRWVLTQITLNVRPEP